MLRVVQNDRIERTPRNAGGANTKKENIHFVNHVTTIQTGIRYKL